MLCSRSASLTSSTRMSSLSASRNLRRFSAARSFSDCASILLSLVTPSTSRATLAPNNFSICSGVATVSSIVSWRIAVTIVSSSSFRSVRMPGDLDRVAEIGVARGAHLGAMRLHREDIGAVDQPFVRVGIVGADLLDEFILPEHRPNVAFRRRSSQAQKRAGAPRRAARPRCEPRACSAARGDLVGAGERRRAAPSRATLLHLSSSVGGKRAAVDEEALEAAGPLGEALAQHQRAAVVGASPGRRPGRRSS